MSGAASSSCGRIRFGCKWIQLILACICVGLFAHAPIDNVHGTESILLSVTFGGYIIVLAGLILGFVCEDRVPKKIDLLYTLLGLALFIAAGSVCISHFNALKEYSKNDTVAMKKLINTGLAAGSISIINGAVFLVDAVLAYRDASEYIPHQ